MFNSIKSKFANLIYKLFPKKQTEEIECFVNGFIKYSDVVKQDKQIECSAKLEKLEAMGS